MTLFKRPGLVAGLIILCAVCAYLPALRNGFVWDDYRYVGAKPSVTAEDGLARAWFSPRAGARDYPVVFTFFRLENLLWGTWSMGFHAASILVHALCAVLFFVLLLRLGIAGAAPAAFLFALSPVCVEPVAWITETKTLLSTAFCLGAALCLARFWSLDAGGLEKNQKAFYVLGLALFVLALMSKTVTAIFPAAMALVIWWKRGRITKREVLALTPFIFLGTGYGLASVLMERFQAGASGPDWDFSLADRLLIAGRAAWFYAAKMVWPQNLVFIYPRWDVDARVWWQYLYPVSVTLVAVFLWRRKQAFGRGPLTAVLFFFISLAPFSGVFNLYMHRYSFVADRFLYLASLGLFALAGAGIARLSHALPGRGRAVVRGAVILVLVLFAAKTWSQCGMYANNETLWRTTAARNPQAWIAHNNLGIIADAKGDRANAVAHYQAALAAKPDLPEAHYNLGVTLAAMGRNTEAISHYRESVRLRPDYAWGHCNLGAALLSQGKMAEAMAHFRKALDISPGFFFANYNLGNALLESGSFIASIPHYEAAVLAAPRFTQARVNLGIALSQMGLWKEAITQFEEALSCDPKLAPAHFNLARAYELSGDRRKSMQHYRLALHYDPGLGRAHARIGEMYAREGKTGQAMYHLQQAISLGPETASLHYNLARLFERTNRRDLAEQHYRRSLAMDPGYADAWNNLGLLRLMRKDQAQALEDFEKALSINPLSIPSLYNMACLYSRQGKGRQAVVWLKKAVDAGFRDQSRLLKDPDLAKARNTSEFKRFFQDNFFPRSGQPPDALLKGV